MKIPYIHLNVSIPTTCPKMITLFVPINRRMLDAQHFPQYQKHCVSYAKPDLASSCTANPIVGVIDP